MAEPSNSDTVSDQENADQENIEQEKAQPKRAAAKAPVKASPLQKSFLERRKAREASAAAGTGANRGGTAGKSSSASVAAQRGSRSGKADSAKAESTEVESADVESAVGSQRVDLNKPGGVAEVRRAGADRGRIKMVGLRVVAGLALIAVIAAAVLFGIGKYRYDQKDELRAEYASFAQQVTVNLTTLTPSNVGQLQKTLLEQTSGYAKQQMEQAVKQTVELVKQGQLSTKTTVLSTAVTRAEPDRGSAIMVFGWTSKPNDPKAEMAVETYRWRVDMTRINGQLKLTNFEWVW